MILLCSLALAAPDSEVVADTPLEPVETVAASGPDRSAPPAVTHAPPRDLPDIAWTEPRPGVQLGVVTVPGVRKVAVRILFRKGSHELDIAAPVAEAVDALWDAGGGDYDAEALEIASDLADTSIGASLSHHTATVSFDAPKENLEAVWPLARAILAEPTFSNREIKLWRWDQRLWYTTQAPTSSRSVEGSLGSYGWFPSTHPYGVRPDLDALDAVKRNELLEAHAAIVASPVRVLVVGDVDATLTDAVVTLLDGLGGPGDPGADLTLGALKAPTLLAVDMPGDQATVSLRYAGPRLNTPDVAAFRAVDYALGGTFLARLNANLREERGLTYGIYSRYYADPGLGTWRTQVTVSADDAGEAITQIRAELDGILDGGASDVEIAAMTREWSAEWNQTLGTADDAMYAYADFADEGRTEAEARAELEALATLTGEQTRKAAATWLAADKPHLWIVVGPKDVLTEQLAATGLEPVWVDAEDAVLGDFADLAREAAP